MDPHGCMGSTRAMMAMHGGRMVQQRNGGQSHGTAVSTSIRLGDDCDSDAIAACWASLQTAFGARHVANIVTQEGNRRERQLLLWAAAHQHIHVAHGATCERLCRHIKCLLNDGMEGCKMCCLSNQQPCMKAPVRWLKYNYVNNCTCVPACLQPSFLLVSTILVGCSMFELTPNVGRLLCISERAWPSYSSFIA